MTPQELHALRTADPPKIERVDINRVTIDMNAPVSVRARQFLEQVKSPYAFRCGDIAVNIEFTPEGKPLREAVKSYLIAQKNKN